MIAHHFSILCLVESAYRFGRLRVTRRFSCPNSISRERTGGQLARTPRSADKIRSWWRELVRLDSFVL
jgi:hypothetical protein